MVGLSGKDPSAYARHALHAHDRAYGETNCYVDVVIELLHAHGYEPLAMLSHIVRMDFEGDQWTFFKPPPNDLELLYGIDIHEMNPYRPLPTQIAEQLARGRAMIVELDSYYLPDLAATAYRREHVKTSCAFDAIDQQAEVLNYFHGPGLFTLSGEDYRGALRTGDLAPEVLPPYTELVRFDAGLRLEDAELRAAARETLRANLRLAPRRNPVTCFGQALAATLPELLEADLSTYHAYAFATVRLLGSGFEALGSFAAWLTGQSANPASAPIQSVVDGAKALSFRLARRRPFDPSEAIAQLERGWSESLEVLAQLAG